MYGVKTYLVDHECLKTISHRIKIVDPPKPGMHVPGWNCKASVYDEG